MVEIKKLLEKYKFPRQSNPSKIIKELQKIEKNINCKLPKDYTYYVTNFSEFEVIINDWSVHTWNVMDILEVSRINYYLDKSILAFGSDGCGNFIGFDYFDKENIRVIFSDMIGVDRSQLIEIGTSFTDMVLRLENGENWFD